MMVGSGSLCKTIVPFGLNSLYNNVLGYEMSHTIWVKCDECGFVTADPARRWFKIFERTTSNGTSWELGSDDVMTGDSTHSNICSAPCMHHYLNRIIIKVSPIRGTPAVQRLPNVLKEYAS